MTAADPTLRLLLAAVCAAPAEDEPRLQFADRLRELGDSDRADFIETQIALAAAPDTTDCTAIAATWCPVCGDCRCPSPENRRDDARCPLHSRLSPHAGGLRERERRLWETAGRPRLVDWGFGIGGRYVVLTPVAGDDFGLGNGDFDGVLRRGFVDEISCTVPDFLAHADELLWSPWFEKSCPYCVDQPPDWETGTVECRQCNSTGVVDYKNHDPCPPTAQPVREVTLTAVPPWIAEPSSVIEVVGEHTGSYVYRLPGRRATVADSVVASGEALLPRLLAAEWPAVKFNLLPAVT